MAAEVTVEKIAKLSKRALAELCEAASEAILDGAGFGWLRPPPEQDFERYWQGVILVPERTLLVGRLDGVIGGSVQLVSPPPVALQILSPRRHGFSQLREGHTARPRRSEKAPPLLWREEA